MGTTQGNWIKCTNFSNFIGLNLSAFPQFPSMETPDVLQFGEFETISRDECAKRFEKANNEKLLRWLHEKNLCVVNDKNGNNGACHGDSGIQMMELMGIK